MSLRKNTYWNLVGSGLPILVALLCIPFLIKKLGSESFGILTLIWAIIGYFSLFDLGVGKALTYELSKLNKQNDNELIASTVKSGLIVTVITGLIGAMIMFIASPSLVNKWLKITPHFQKDALFAFYVASIGVLPTTLTSGLRGALEGLDRFKASNASKTLIGIFMFALPVISIQLHGNNLTLITIYLVLARLCVLFFAIFQLKSYIFSFNKYTLAVNFKPLINYGFWVTVSGVIGPLMVYGDRFFVSAFVGAATLPTYSIPQEGLLRILILPTAFSSALFPKLANATSSEKEAIYKANLKKVSWTMLGICLLASITCYPLLAVWISKDFAESAFIVCQILIVGVFINSISLIPVTFIQSTGNTKAVALTHCAELLIYVVVLYFLTKEFGLEGAAGAWMIRQLTDLFLLLFISKKILVK